MRHSSAWPMILILLAGGEVLGQDTTSARFSSSLPEELQFSDGIGLDGEEEALAKTLAEGDPTDRLAAARALWRGQSRRHATEVLMLLAGPPPGGEAFRSFQREVEATLQPQGILRELKQGQYQWGAWLAFVRPHKDLFPPLLEALKDKPNSHAETLLALGNSGDPRALKPLLDRLKSKDHWIPGEAAQALGYLGNPEAEPKLIEALAADNGYLQVKACRALATMGSSRALPVLERLAKDDRYTGALSIQGMAKYAIERTRKREKR